MIDWDNIEKDECILCILRDKETKKALRAEWSPYPLERTLNNIKKCNEQNAYAYYEICDDEDIRKLIPLTLSNRQRTLNDIYDKLKEVSNELDWVEDNMIAARNVIEDMQEQIDKYMKEYVKEQDV